MNNKSYAPEEEQASKFPYTSKKRIPWFVGAVVLTGVLAGGVMLANKEAGSTSPAPVTTNTGIPEDKADDTAGFKRADVTDGIAAAPVLDTALYNSKLAHMLNGDSSGRWQAAAKYPAAGAILPFNRVIAYYGNLYSKRMGILGELPPKQMLEKLQGEVKKWETADSSTKVVPALHYIAVTAQNSPGKGGKYILRMPFHQIDSVLSIASQIGAIVFLDIQVGLSSLGHEIPQLDSFLRMPNVHLGIDPEFSMKTGAAPGKAVGTFDASDINFASDHLAKLVRDNNLPPKMLVVHRFTQGMVTNYRKIKTPPEVQLVMHMDGWGYGAKKINTYKQFIYNEPVQFTGFKLFYKNDVKENGRLLTPEELLQLKPRPLYIQYQ